MKQILVKEVMTPAENVITISPYARVRELLALMQSKSVKSVVVERTSEHDAYGLVTYTSILNAIFAEDGDIDLINVYDIAAPGNSIYDTRPGSWCATASTAWW